MQTNRPRFAALPQHPPLVILAAALTGAGAWHDAAWSTGVIITFGLTAAALIVGAYLLPRLDALGEEEEIEWRRRIAGELLAEAEELERDGAEAGVPPPGKTPTPAPHPRGATSGRERLPRLQLIGHEDERRERLK